MKHRVFPQLHLRASRGASRLQEAAVRRYLLWLLAVAAGVLVPVGTALAQVRPDAWFFEIDGDYGSSIVDSKPGYGGHDQLADDVTDGGATTYGTRDTPYCSHWVHTAERPYMGSQAYSVACFPVSGVRSEQLLVKWWYPGTDSRRTVSFAVRVRGVPWTATKVRGYIAQFHQGGEQPPPFRLQWRTDAQGNMSVEGGVRWDRLAGTTLVQEYESVLEAPIERNVWQRFILQLDPGPAVGWGPCPHGPGKRGSVTVWKMDNATGEWIQHTPTYRGQVGYRYSQSTGDCREGDALEYQWKLGEYTVEHLNILDFDNVAYGKRWNNITKNRLIGYKKSVLRLPFEEPWGLLVQDRSWTWNGGVAGDPTKDYDNNGTIVGAVLRNSYGVNGRSLRFDGSNFVGVPIDTTDFDVGNYVTVSAWFRTSALPIDNKGLVMIDEYSSTWKTLLYTSRNSVSFGVRHPGTYSRLDHIVRIGRYADNQWHLVTGTFNRFAADGQRIKLYIDGVKVLEGDGKDLPVLRGDNRLTVGKFSVDGYFVGDIDDVGLFNYAMTEKDVANLWLRRGAP